MKLNKYNYAERQQKTERDKKLQKEENTIKVQMK